MVEFYFKNYEIIDQVFAHFFNHFIFYFFLFFNFFLIRFFKYEIDNNNNIVRNYKKFEEGRIIIDSTRLNFHFEFLRLTYYFVGDGCIVICVLNL